MGRIAPVYWIVIGTGIGMALVGQELMMGFSLGMGFALLVLVGATVLAIAHAQDLIEKSPKIHVSIAGMLIAAYGFAFTDSNGLDAVNFFTLTTAGGLLLVWAGQKGYPHWSRTMIASHFVPLLLPFVGLAVPFTIVRDQKAEAPVDDKKGDRARGVGLGLVLAIPFLLIVGGLLRSADPLFAQLTNFQITISYEEVFSRVITGSFVGLVTLGVCGRLVPEFRRRIDAAIAGDVKEPQSQAVTSSDPAVLRTAYMTFFTLAGLLFVLFLGVQARVLLGGHEYVLKTAGLSYSTYARTGFFQIVGATAVTLPILFGAQLVTREWTGADKRLAQAVLWIFSVLLLLLLASACYRIGLYVQAYGLTSARVFVCAAMVWMTAVIGLFAWLGSKWEFDRFGHMAIVAAFATVLGLNVVKPDALVAHLSLAQPQARDYSVIGATGWDANQIVQSSGDEQAIEAWNGTYRELPERLIDRSFPQIND